MSALTTSTRAARAAAVTDARMAAAAMGTRPGTALNVVAMLAFWSQLQVTSAQAVPDVLRAKGLEIVDDRGFVLAQIIVQPGGDTVLFRLIDQKHKPLVKLGAGADGSGLMLTGDPATQDWTGIQVLAKPAGSTLRLLNLAGKERVIQPE